uniref:Uncharacterized protein n=1 Tax=Arundo donax TaxID=35708 RepID=A0A0A9C761_ARUDO
MNGCQVNKQISKLHLASHKKHKIYPAIAGYIAQYHQMQYSRSKRKMVSDGYITGYQF